MKRNHFFVGTAIAVLLATSFSAPSQVTFAASEQAATTATAVPTADDAVAYTADEQAKILDFQNQYADLTGSGDSVFNLYQTTPGVTDTFSPGVLLPATINKTVAWVNYYRALSGLPAINSDDDSNQLAQISSAVMAYAQSDQTKDQHGLKNTTKPDAISALYWNRAVLGTSESDLYFGFPNTIGSIVRDLEIDDTNIESNAGHRAWLQSPFLSKIGVGIATSMTGRQYASLLVANGADQYRTPDKEIVTYPGSGLFPVEELTGSKNQTNIFWSMMFASDENLVTDDTTITVTNMTTGATGTVFPSYHGSEAYSGTVVDFIPPTNVPINGHSQYKVTINGLNSDSMPSYSYTFKTFSEKGVNNTK